MNTYMIIAAWLAFIMAWRQARRLDLVGMCGFLAIVLTMVVPLSSARYSADIVNVSVFIVVGLLFLAPIRVYYVGWRRSRQPAQ